MACSRASIVLPDASGPVVSDTVAPSPNRDYRRWVVGEEIVHDRGVAGVALGWDTFSTQVSKAARSPDGGNPLAAGFAAIAAVLERSSRLFKPR